MKFDLKAGRPYFKDNAIFTYMGRFEELTMAFLVSSMSVMIPS